jgi:hypothetical protein
MVFLNVPMMPQPEAYIGNAKTLFDDNGALISDSTRAFLQKFLRRSRRGSRAIRRVEARRASR